MLRRNIGNNSQRETPRGDGGVEWVYPRGGRVRVRELDWFDGTTYADPDVDPEVGYQLVVAADTIYNEVVTLQFVAALAALCSGMGGVAAPIPAIVV